jgi:ubiquitin C-terminal hydrolase
MSINLIKDNFTQIFSPTNSQFSAPLQRDKVQNVASLFFLSLGVISCFAKGFHTFFGLSPHFLPERVSNLFTLGALLSSLAGVLFFSFSSSKKTTLPPTGIKNPSSNCWINSLMQFCRNTPPLNAFLQNQKTSDKLYPITSFLAQYEKDQLSNTLVSSADSQEVRLCLNKMAPQSFEAKACVQCDASEALGILLDQMPSSMCVKKTNHHTTWEGHWIFAEKIQWTSGTDKFERLPKIELPLKSSRTFLQLLDSFFLSSEEPVDGVIVPKTMEKTTVLTYQKSQIEEAPKDLFISLNRFTMKKKGFFNSEYEQKKISDPIKVPNSFVLKNEFVSKGSGGCYEVDAFVSHIGTSPKNGHYIAYVKSPNGLWYECNDSHVRTLNSQEVETAKSTAYFFHFHKC